MVKLRRLEIATEYLTILEEVERLRTEADRSLGDSPRVALASCSHLRRLSLALSDAQQAAEGAAPQLVSDAEEASNQVHERVKDGLIKNFSETLSKMKWPQQDMNIHGGILHIWAEQADLLLELQEPDLVRASADISILLPLEVMVQPLAQRFRFHFYGDKPTNRLDKPEYFFSHILDLLGRHSQFLVDNLQPILDRRTDRLADVDTVYTDAVSSLLTALLPIVTAKSLSLLPQIASHPQLLSHFINELMSFDNTLREVWNYVPTANDLTYWKGLTWTILDRHGYFDQWLRVEKEFALERYRSIRDAADSAEIDYDGVGLEDTKPTKGTFRANQLLETITDRYRGLTSFSQKMKFLIQIQLSIFDDHHAHLHGALQAYLASSHTAGRLLQGQYSKHEAFDQKALASLCKIYGSAEYLETKMRDWSDDVFFLELWDELQDRTMANSGVNASIGKGLRVDEVASKTSASIRHNTNADHEAEGGALFDETALAYRRLKESAEREVLRLLEVNIREALGPYTKLDTWASLSPTPSDPGALNPSSSLDGLLQTISLLLGFLSKVLARPTRRRIVKHFCSTVQQEIISNVLLTHIFSAAGVAQAMRDTSTIESAVDAACGLRGVGNPSLRKLNQALMLLGLPIKTSSGPRVGDEPDEGDDAWGFGDGQEEEEADDQDTDNDGWGLWEAERAIFKSNEAAREALLDMGLDHLSEQEARNLIKRRVEING